MPGSSGEISCRCSGAIQVEMLASTVRWRSSQMTRCKSRIVEETKRMGHARMDRGVSQTTPRPSNSDAQRRRPKGPPLQDTLRLSVRGRPRRSAVDIYPCFPRPDRPALTGRRLVPGEGACAFSNLESRVAPSRTRGHGYTSERASSWSKAHVAYGRYRDAALGDSRCGC